jgi:site-specific recombinase XerD
MVQIESLCHEDGRVSVQSGVRHSSSCDNEGKRLSTNSIYNIVRTRATDAGITKVMSPHRVRHSAITTALDVTGGDVRRVQNPHFSQTEERT